MKRVGILGRGQLGTLLSQSIIRLGGEAIIYDPDPNAPGLRGVHQFINAAWDDKEALSLLFQQCDVVTYEFENVPSSVLLDFIDHKPILPTAKVLETTQNRMLEKDFLKRSKLPHVNFVIARDAVDLEAVSKELSFPVVIKSTTGGYDGKMQRFIQSEDSLNKIIQELKSRNVDIFPAVVEEAIDLYLEVSCITASDQYGQHCSFPVFENEHANHILDTTLVPARISKKLQDKIVELALAAARKLGVVGILCTEFFISKVNNAGKTGYQCDNHFIYINEFAPRPHNSGHVSINACSISQFDALARVLLGIPINQPKLLASGYFCMANLLGEVWLNQNQGKSDELDLSALNDRKEVIDLILYGKKEARVQRKMGHIVTYSSNAELAINAARTFRNELGGVQRPPTLTDRED